MLTNMLPNFVTSNEQILEFRLFLTLSIGSLSNYDDDHNDYEKNNRFNDQNNSSARASCLLVHFFDVHCTTTT